MDPTNTCCATAVPPHDAMGSNIVSHGKKGKLTQSFHGVEFLVVSSDYAELSSSGTPRNRLVLAL